MLRLPSNRFSTGWEGIETVTEFFSSRIDKMNAWADRSWIGRFFTFRDRQARLGKESSHLTVFSLERVPKKMMADFELVSEKNQR